MIIWRADPDLRRLRTGSRANVKRTVQGKLNTVGRMYAEAMKAEAPRSATSSLHGADRIRFRLGDGVIDFTMPAYFRYVVKGTSAHDIEARSGGALAFEWDGQTVFFRRVRHPGTQPNNFIRRAWLAIRRDALAVLGSAMREWWVGK